jgi:hypothetical protein
MTLQNSSFMRWTSRVMIVLMTCMAMPLTASAAMVETDVVVDHALAEQGRAKIMALMNRDDVRAQLEVRGVTSEQAQARVISRSETPSTPRVAKRSRAASISFPRASWPRSTALVLRWPESKSFELDRNGVSPTVETAQNPKSSSGSGSIGSVSELDPFLPSTFVDRIRRLC